MNFKKGFLKQGSNYIPEALSSPQPPSVVPMVFKIDFTIDSNNELRIFELGHHFSSHRYLENYFINLFNKLKAMYDHVYYSGDHYPAALFSLQFYHNSLELPVFIPVEELYNIKTKNSIVIIRMLESPSHYRPYLIQQQLRERGSDLSVFGAAPYGCLMAYEKILMQRFQLSLNPLSNQSIPSALINLASSESLESQLHSQFYSQRSPIDRINFILKPAFSTCGKGIQYVGTKQEILQLLHEMRRKHLLVNTIPYRRTAETFFSMLAVGDLSMNLSQRLETLAKFLSANDLEDLVTDLDFNQPEDPFWIVQQMVHSPLLKVGEKSFLPTYRTFIFIEENENKTSAKISFLEKITVLCPKTSFNPHAITTESVLASIMTSKVESSVLETATQTILHTLNNTEYSNFFYQLLHFHDNTRDSLLRQYPELVPYYTAMMTYPPYQRMFSPSSSSSSFSSVQDNNQIIRYEKFLIIFLMQIYFHYSESEGIPHHQLAMSLADLSLRCWVQGWNFPRNLFCENIKIHMTRSKQQDKIFYEEPLRVHLAVLIMKIQSLELSSRGGPHVIQVKDVENIENSLKSFLKLLFKTYFNVTYLFQMEMNTWEASQAVLYFQLIQQKPIRDILLRYTCQLCSFREILHRNNLEMRSETIHQWNIFLGWLLKYFALFPVPLSDLNDNPTPTPPIVEQITEAER